jgi:hypothetical protein
MVFVFIGGMLDHLLDQFQKGMDFENIEGLCTFENFKIPPYEIGYLVTTRDIPRKEHLLQSFDRFVSTLLTTSVLFRNTGNAKSIQLKHVKSASTLHCPRYTDLGNAATTSFTVSLS